MLQIGADIGVMHSSSAHELGSACLEPSLQKAFRESHGWHDPCLWLHQVFTIQRHDDRTSKRGDETMKPGRFAVGLMLMAGSLSATAAQATKGDEALCRGSYPVLLMTEQECISYTRQVLALQSTGQVRALATLQQQHELKLRERAAICPCSDAKPNAAAPQHLVMLEPDC
jgi:hypothetical protein